LVFHANFYARPAALRAGGAAQLRGLELATLCEADGTPPTYVDFFPVTFEQTMERLAELPGVDAEPDGFFVVSGGPREDRWRVSGHLWDFSDRLHRMELHGECPAETLQALWRCCGGPEAAIACELVREGVALDEATFLRWAAAPAGPSC
jgi:hypothetical protein